MKNYVIKTIEPNMNQPFYVLNWEMKNNKVSNVRLSADINEAMLFDLEPTSHYSPFPDIKNIIENIYHFTDVKPAYVERTTTIVEE